MSAGVALFYLGLAMGESLVAARVAVLLAGFRIAVYALLHVLIRVKEKDREQDSRHGTAASGGLISGWLGIAAYLLCADGQPGTARIYTNGRDLVFPAPDCHDGEPPDDPLFFPAACWTIMFWYARTGYSG